MSFFLGEGVFNCSGDDFFDLFGDGPSTGGLPRFLVFLGLLGFVLEAIFALVAADFLEVLLSLGGGALGGALGAALGAALGGAL